jgi:Iron-containing redox enzyme
MTPPLPDELANEAADRCAEDRFVARERVAIAPLLEGAPDDADAFVAWFEGLEGTGPGQGDPLFPWLAHEATLADVRWFLGQEVAGEAGFDDLVALTQLRMPAGPKLEMARNVWDEMGRGHAGGVHALMLSNLADTLQVRIAREETVWPSLALANMMMALAWNRHYAFQSVGALGVIELTAPGRAAQVDAALKRLGIAAEQRRYFAVHAVLDVRHSKAWLQEVIRPLVADDRRCARLIAEGALLRLRAGARCFDCYRRELGLRDLGRA